MTTKLKGVALANFSNFESPLLNGMHIFDPADYVIPPQVCDHASSAFICHFCHNEIEKACFYI